MLKMCSTDVNLILRVYEESIIEIYMYRLYGFQIQMQMYMYTCVSMLLLCL